MKTSIKLKASELHSLTELLENTVHTDKCSDRMEAIVATLLLKFYLVLKKKSIMLEKPSLTINVEPETAMAFVEFFCDYPMQCYSHAGNVVTKMISHYDQQTANFFK